MAGAPGRFSTLKLTSMALIALVAALFAAAAFVLAARATDASSFCETCHEMTPYCTAWQAGLHAEEGVQCVDCHVDAGVAPRLAHKFVALGEVWAHFFGNTSFPLATPSDVPDYRCERCHTKVTTTLKNFSHKLHVSKGACEDCHPTTGHAVNAEALKAAGILNPNVSPPVLKLTVAVVNGGSANLPGHVVVACSRCHDMKATGCRECHKPPHQERGDCATCHEPGRAFVFSHPDSSSCADCHKPPRIHPAAALGKACDLCHVAGKSWGFSHASAGANCSNCHRPPAGHYAGTCASCHRNVGRSWAFSHPSAGEHSWRSLPCKNCHPDGYTDYYCTCHKDRPPNVFEMTRKRGESS